MVVRRLLPFLCLLVLAGCGHMRSAGTTSVSRYPERFADGGYEDGSYSAKSNDNDGVELSRATRAQKVRREVLGVALEMTGAMLADSAVRRRSAPGSRRDLNDEVESAVYSMLIRIAAQTLRELILEAHPTR